MIAQPIDPIDHSAFASLAELVDLDAASRAWRAYAACREHPEVDFYPSRGESTRAAKAICAGCPVKEPCLEAAMRNGEKHGIWGGLSERERRRLRREQTGRPALGQAIVDHLAAHGPHHGTASELADAIGHHRVNTAATVTHMERKGLVDVDPPLPRLHGTAIRTITLKETTP